MKITGYRRSDFTINGEKITGYNLFISKVIPASVGEGYETEKQYLSDKKIATENINLAEVFNKEVEIFYNKFGKIARIEVVD